MLKSDKAAETSEKAGADKRPRINRSYLLAGLLALGAVAWIVSGMVGDEAEPVDGSAAKPAAATAQVKVRIVDLQAVERPRYIVVTGRTNAINDAEIKAETAGQVVARPARKGSLVQKGTVLLELAMDDRQTRLKDAEARAGAATITYNASKDLQRKQFESQIKLAESNATLATAEADLEEIKLEIARTKIRAPIAGYIETLLPGPGDYVEKGELVAMVVDLDPIRVIVNVTERDVGNIHVDDLATVKLPNGREVGASVNYISRVADDVTRTFRVDLWVDNPDASIPAGLTAEVQLTAGNRKAHMIRTSALTLNDLGVLGVRTVDADDIVHFMPVTLLDDTPDGAWIAGLPETVRVITVGQEFVIDGQKVETSDSAAAKPEGGAGS